jgi:hypothetical protein
MRAPVCLALCACVVSFDVAAESMRCGKWVINETASVAELLDKCGAPLEKKSTTEDVRAINAAGVAYKTGTTTTREQWFYQRSSRALPMVVTIVDGAIKSIERAE